MLIDKYFPTTLSEFKDQEKVYNFLIRFLLLNSEKFNVLISGPPGSGKTSLARFLSNSRNNFYKWDNLSIIEQDKLWGQLNSNINILVCNNIENISQIIKSKCIHLNLKKPSISFIEQHLKNILNKENIKYDPLILSKIAYYSNFNLNRAVTLIEQFYILNGEINSSIYDNWVTEEELISLTETLFSINPLFPSIQALKNKMSIGEILSMWREFLFRVHSYMYGIKDEYSPEIQEFSKKISIKQVESVLSFFTFAITQYKVDADDRILDILFIELDSLAKGEELNDFTFITPRKNKKLIGGANIKKPFNVVKVEDESNLTMDEVERILRG